MSIGPDEHGPDGAPEPPTPENAGGQDGAGEDLQSPDNLRLMMRHEIERMGPDMVRSGLESMFLGAMTDPEGEDGRQLGLVMEAVKSEIGKDLVPKAAELAKELAKAEIERDAKRVRDQITTEAGGGGGGNGAPPFNGGGGSHHGGAGDPDDEDTYSETGDDQVQPNGTAGTLGKRVVQRLKENPDLYIEKGLGYVERVLDMIDRRKNPFETLARFHEDPSGMGRAAIGMYAPDIMGDRIPTMMQRVGEMAFRAGQASKLEKGTPLWQPEDSPSTTGPSTSERSTEPAAAPFAEPRPEPSASATSTAVSSPASATPAAPPTTATRMSDLA